MFSSPALVIYLGCQLQIKSKTRKHYTDAFELLNVCVVDGLRLLRTVTNVYCPPLVTSSEERQKPLQPYSKNSNEAICWAINRASSSSPGRLQRLAASRAGISATVDNRGDNGQSYISVPSCLLRCITRRFRRIFVCRKNKL